MVRRSVFWNRISKRWISRHWLRRWKCCKRVKLSFWNSPIMQLWDIPIYLISKWCGKRILGCFNENHYYKCSRHPEFCCKFISTNKGLRSRCVSWNRISLPRIHDFHAIFFDSRQWNEERNTGSWLWEGELFMDGVERPKVKVLYTITSLYA